jgi:hypothetical protein
MKKYQFLLPIIILITGSGSPQPDAPGGLMTEFIREPSGVVIMDLKPEFSWIVPAGIKFQKAYQIMVASSKTGLEKNIADVWDSKKVISGKSSEVEFNGGSLKPGSTCHWKVRIWDEKNILSDFSEIQSFTTGNPASYNTTRNKFLCPSEEPVLFKKSGPRKYFADFGKDAFGSLLIELKNVTDDTIIVHLGEKLTISGEIDRNPGGTIRYSKFKIAGKPGLFSSSSCLPADKRNTGPAAIRLPDSLGVITPFRYCEIENWPGDLKSSDLSRKSLWYYFDDRLSSFTSSDTTLNQVWDICKYSMKATSFAGIYVDGDRERIPYEADAYINQLGHYYTDREYSIARLTNEYFIKHPTWPTEWILHTVPMFYYDLMYTGNMESVRNFYNYLKHKNLLALARNDGLISAKMCSDEIMKTLGFANEKERLRDIVDWPPAQKDTGWKLATPEGERDGYDMKEINTVVNALYYNSLRLMSELAGYLGKKEDQEFYLLTASRVKESINRVLIDKRTGIYIDGEASEHSSLHANMMALAFGLVPDENKEKVISFIKSRGMACSVYGAQYLLEGLYRAGESDYALSLMNSTNDRSWWNMIRSGSTITLEAWDMKYKPNSDWNHAWGAAPANIIPRFMWGIAPAEPGYAKASIEPQLAGLKQSKVSVPTIRGNIEAEFNLTKSGKEYKITIPANMECDFIISDHSNNVVLLNNIQIEKRSEVLKLKPGFNKIEILKNI